MRLKPTSVLDILGISSATICLVHCFVFPLLTILQFTFINGPWIDIAFAIVGMLVVYKILMSNADIKVKFILLLSILTAIIGIILEIIFKTESSLVLVGGIGMITGHMLNLKAHRHE